MCYEHFMRRRRREADESEPLWEDFERTRPISDPEPPEVSATEATEAREEVIGSER